MREGGGLGFAGLLLAGVSGTDVRGWGAGGVFSLSDSDNEPAIRAKTGQLLEWDSKGLAAGERRAQALALEAGLRSGMMIPLISNGQVIGGFYLRSKKRNAYTQKDVELGERVSAQVAGAIANAQLHSSLQRESTERETVATISRIITSAVDMDEIYKRFASEIAKFISFDGISIGIVEVDSDTLRHVYVAGTEIPGWTRGGSIDVSGSIDQRAVQTKRGRLFGQDAEAETFEEYHSESTARMAGLRSRMSVPLVWNDEVIGTFNLRSKRFNAYTRSDLELAERVAGQVAGLIAHGQVNSSLRAEAVEREALAGIGRLITSSLDMGDVYEPLTTRIGRLIQFDRLSIAVYDFESKSIEHSFTWGVELPRHGTPPPTLEWMLK